MIDDPTCPWCLTKEETVGHALFDCVRVRDLWEEAGCSAMVGWRDAGDMRALVSSWKEVEARTKQRGLFLAWCIWGERNQRVFSNKFTPNVVLLERVRRYVEEHGKYTAKVYNAARPRVPRSPKVWVAPPEGVIKINADASLAVDGWVGLGIVARDNTGSVIFAGTRRMRAHWPPDIVEAKALAMAARLGAKYGVKDIIIESDCQVLIKRLTKGATYFSDLDSVLSDIMALCVNFNSVNWSHVKREGNFVAHHLAKLVPFGVEQVWENHCPQDIVPYVTMDFLSLK